MRIAHRMYLTVIPAILGVVVVAALAYWGEYQRTVPGIVLAVATIATLATLAMAWVNARYVALRVERLAGAEGGAAVSLRGIASAVAPGRVAAAPDELDTIESVVDRLSSAVAVAESGKEQRDREAGERARDYAVLMATLAEDVAKRLAEVRLPLHILLENHFGELNENQDEMLTAARTAADAADRDVAAMQRLADLDRGARTLRRDRILPGDLVKAMLPTLQAQAEADGRSLHVDLEPLVPAITGDQPVLQESLASLLGGAMAGAGEHQMDLKLEKAAEGCVITLRGAGDVPRTVHTALAIRLIGTMGGRVTRAPHCVEVALR